MSNKSQTLKLILLSCIGLCKMQIAHCQNPGDFFISNCRNTPCYSEDVHDKIRIGAGFHGPMDYGWLVGFFNRNPYAVQINYIVSGPAGAIGTFQAQASAGSLTPNKKVVSGELAELTVYISSIKLLAVKKVKAFNKKIAAPPVSPKTN